MSTSSKAETHETIELEPASRSGKGTIKRKRFVTLAIICCMVALFAVVACSPAEDNTQEPAVSQGEQADLQDSSAVVVMQNSENNAGLLPETTYNTDYINAGNRGCNACHGDLGVLMENSGLGHISLESEYGKTISIQDCLPCHRQHWQGSGPYYGDMLHVKHYNNETFEGNCWSCHAQDSAGAVGESQWLLWDEFKYTASLGGFPTGYFDERVTGWLIARGVSESGAMTGITVESEPNITVELNQDETDEDNVFVLNNYGTWEIDESEWRLAVSGVANPTELTLNDLKALPVYETTATQVCFTSAENSPFAANMPMKGVLLADVIEATGGLAEGTNMFSLAGADGWSTGVTVELLLEQNAFIAYEYYGHELTADQGYPATLVIPGMPGAPWVKHIALVNGIKAPPENLVNGYVLRSDGVTSHRANSAWFHNDGVSFTSGETAELTGYAFAWNAAPAAPLKTISFSFDYGSTWTDIEVPANFDANQWSAFTLKWTPPSAGTYVLWVKAINEDGYEQEVPSGLFVTVK